MNRRQFFSAVPRILGSAAPMVMGIDLAKEPSRTAFGTIGERGPEIIVPLGNSDHAIKLVKEAAYRAVRDNLIRRG